MAFRIFLNRRIFVLQLLLHQLLVPPIEGRYIPMPEFIEPMSNTTAILGQTAIFVCKVHGLGGFKVGWIRKETGEALAANKRIITSDPRISVSRAQDEWRLQIRNVQRQDRGRYICQLNSDPMIKQEAYLRVLVPPHINSKISNAHVRVEGENVTLTCSARGRPTPRIEWKKHNDEDIVFENCSAKTVQGPHLTFKKLRLENDGIYVCKAINGVPPSSIRLFYLSVLPMDDPPSTTNSPLGSSPEVIESPLQVGSTFPCYPKVTKTWKDMEEKIWAYDGKHQVDTKATAAFETCMSLSMNEVEEQEDGNYTCTIEWKGVLVCKSVSLYVKKAPTDGSHVDDVTMSVRSEDATEGIDKTTPYVNATLPPWSWEYIVRNAVRTEVRLDPDSATALKISVPLFFLTLMLM